MKHFTTLTFFFLAIHLFGQNLVVNGSFENFLECPDDQYEIDQAEPWSSFRNTPDFFHACDETNVAGVPYSSINGYQEPLVGEGHAGFIALGFVNTHEIIGTSLSQSLEVGVDYYVSLYVNRGFGGGAHSNCDCAINNIGLKFLDEAYTIDNPIPIDNQADILFEEVIVDTVGWTHISGWFTADQAYSHIAIGNFFDPQSNTIENFNDEPFYKTYYFLDEVCISANPEDCKLSLSSSESQIRESVIQLFPNPTNGVFKVSSSERLEAYELYDSFGKRVGGGRLDALENEEIDISDLPQGLYTVSVVRVNGERVQSRIIKN